MADPPGMCALRRHSPLGRHDLLLTVESLHSLGVMGTDEERSPAGQWAPTALQVEDAAESLYLYQPYWDDDDDDEPVPWSEIDDADRTVFRGQTRAALIAAGQQAVEDYPDDDAVDAAASALWLTLHDSSELAPAWATLTADTHDAMRAQARRLLGV